MVFIFNSIISVYLFFLRHIIAAQSAMNGVFNIMSCMKTNWSTVACNVVWSVLCIAKVVASSIPAKG